MKNKVNSDESPKLGLITQIYDPWNSRLGLD
jgi:hypothetical protein